MAKRRSREQSLFDNLDEATAESPGREAVRGPRGGGGAGTTDAVALHEAAQSR